MHRIRATGKAPSLRRRSWPCYSQEFRPLCRGMTIVPRLVLRSKAVHRYEGRTAGKSDRGLPVPRSRTESCPANTQIAYNSGSVGALTVTGPGSELNNTGAAYVGLGGSGTMTIQDSGQASDSSAEVGAFSGSFGNVVVDDGTWMTSGLLDVGVGGMGVVTVEDGGELVAGALDVGGNGTLIIDPATVNVSGDFTLDANGELLLAISGITPDLISQLDISGFGLFQGTIDLDFIDGFAPAMGEKFDIINSLGADFSDATIQIQGLDPGFQYTESFADGQFTLVADNNGVSTPEPGSMWLVGTGLAVLCAVGIMAKLKSKS
jgi:T5SS/PEP-CTERM-associated repeat protein